MLPLCAATGQYPFCLLQVVAGETFGYLEYKFTFEVLGDKLITSISSSLNISL